MSTPAALQFLALTLAKVTLLFGVAGAIDVLALRGRASAAARHMLWTLAAVASLLVPVLGQLLPSVRAPMLASKAAPELAVSEPSRLVAPNVTIASRGVPATGVSRSPQVPMGAKRTGSTPETPETVATRALSGPSLPRLSLGGALLLIYVVGALFLLVRIAVDHAVVWRITRNARVVTDATWTSLLRSVVGRSRVRRPVVLLRSRTSVMPLTSGFLRPRIVVPDVADAWPSHMREAVVMHEMAHIARGDYLTQSLAAIASALYWPTPLVWWAASRLRVERELACDDLVLTRGVHADDYAAHLLDAARVLRTPRLAVSMAAAHGLERRLRAIIDDTRRRSVPTTRSMLVAAVCTLGLVATLAAVRPVQVEATAPVPTRDHSTPASAPSFTPGMQPAVIRASLTTDTSIGQSARDSSTDSTNGATSIATAITVQQPAPGGSFSVRLTTPTDPPALAGRIHVMLQTPGLNTFYEEASHFEGLIRDQFAVPGTPLRFRLRRDAGTFEFTGTMRSGYGAGQFDFTADPGFADSLARRGIGAPSTEQQFSLARHDVSLAFIDELKAQGYATPTVTQLVRAGTSGADLTYLREMAALGYREPTVDAIIRLSNQGVEPPFIRELARGGYVQLPASELVALRNHSIDVAFIKDANTRVGRNLTTRELVQYRNGGFARGVQPAPAAPSATTSPTPPADTSSTPRFDDTVVNGRWTIASRPDGWLQLDIEWANINQWRRFVRPSDLPGLSTSDIQAGSPKAAFRIEQDAGVFDFTGSFERGRGAGQFAFAANLSFPATLRSLGIREAEQVGIHQLKNLAFGFISASAVREFLGAGLPPMTLEQLTNFAVWQVSPGYVRDLRASGIQGILTVEGVSELKFHNVPAAYATDVSALGFKGITHRQLLEMYRASVTPAFIRQQQDAGRRDLTPEELIDLRTRRQ